MSTTKVEGLAVDVQEVCVLLKVKGEIAEVEELKSFTQDERT